MESPDNAARLMTPTAENRGGIIVEDPPQGGFFVCRVPMNRCRKRFLSAASGALAKTMLDQWSIGQAPYRDLRSYVSWIDHPMLRHEGLVVTEEGANSMCDYSLHNVASRPARVGDRLVTTEFANTVTQGFCGVGEPSVAVCLRPGTELAFDREPEYWRPFTRWLPRKRPSRIASAVARFRQTNLRRPDTHHDALEFPDGTIVLLTRLRAGQRATVLQLPPEQDKTTIPDRQKAPIGAG